jgi:hypothetical protein
MVRRGEYGLVSDEGVTVMSFHRPIQLGVLLIALVVSGSVALAHQI